MPKDYYRILNIPKDASEMDINKAYKKYSQLHHPVRRRRVKQPMTPPPMENEQRADEERKTLESLQMFHLVGEAYEVLSDALYRAVYDHFGELGLKGGFIGEGGEFTAYAYHGDPYRTYREFFGSENPFADYFYEACGPMDALANQESHDLRVKQAPVYKDLYLTLEEIYNGCMKKIMACRRVYYDEQKRTEQMEKILTFHIAPGTKTGTQFIFSSEGDEGPSIAPADLIFVVREKEHPTYKREGDDLILYQDVSLCQGLTGMTIRIKHLNKRAFTVAVVHIITPGYEKVIFGEGFPIIEDKGRKGNLIIRFNVAYPNTLTQDQKRLMKESLECNMFDDAIDGCLKKPSGKTPFAKRPPETYPEIPKIDMCPCPIVEDEVDSPDLKNAYLEVDDDNYDYDVYFGEGDGGNDPNKELGAGSIQEFQKLIPTSNFSI